MICGECDLSCESCNLLTKKDCVCGQSCAQPVVHSFDAVIVCLWNGDKWQ